MSEAHGSLLVKAKPEILGLIMKGVEGEESVGQDAIVALLTAAHVERNVIERCLLGGYPFSLDEDPVREMRGEYLLLNVFGSEWADAIGTIVQRGSGGDVEVYGSIADEHGPVCYFALNSNGRRFFKVVDFECDVNSLIESQIIELWLSLVPAEMHPLLPNKQPVGDGEGGGIVLEDQYIVFTGKMQEGTREEMEDMASSVGAIVQKEVNGKTNILVIGERVGEKKLSKAKESGVIIISEAQFIEALDYC